MKNKDTKEIIFTAVSLFLICAVCAGILAGVNTITAPTISSNAVAAAEKSRGEVLPGAVSFEEIALSDGAVGYIGFDEGGSEIGYVFTTSSSGYGGAVEIMTGFDTEGVVTGLTILTINETPGLGMNAKKDEFKNQYTGKTGELTVTKNDNPGESEIKAITSATITSRAVTNSVNKAYGYFTEAASGKEAQP